MAGGCSKYYGEELMNNLQSVRNLRSALITVGIILLPINFFIGGLVSSIYFEGFPPILQFIVGILPSVSSVSLLISGVILLKKNNIAILAQYVSVISAIIWFVVTFNSQHYSNINEALGPFLFTVGIYLAILIVTIKTVNKMQRNSTN